jgi:hypothetical protein
VQVASISALTHLTQLEVTPAPSHVTLDPEQLGTLSACSLLQKVGLGGVQNTAWLPLCMSTWHTQLKELQLPGCDLRRGDLVVLAAAPMLHTLECGSLDLAGDAEVTLAALQQLRFSTGRARTSATPAQLASISLPSLLSVAGSWTVELVCSGGSSAQVVADIKRAVEGILTWSHSLSLKCGHSPAAAADVMDALSRWRPVHRGHPCTLTLDAVCCGSAEALSKIPPAVQELK